MSVAIEFDENAIKAKIDRRLSKAIPVLTAQVLKDSNYYCPVDTSMLAKSAVVHTTLLSGQITWKTPYAKRQYYNWKGGANSRNSNPNATSRWFETAKAEKMKEWESLVNDAYTQGN